MTVVQAIVLSIVQGLTEFFPISSSGHLVLVTWLLGWTDAGAVFDATAHLGSLLAVVVWSWRDWRSLIYDGVRGRPWLTTGANELKVASQLPARRLIIILIIGTVPVAVVGGLTGSDLFGAGWRTPVAAGVSLLITGAALVAIHLKANGQRQIGNLAVKDGVIVGLAQAVAIIPGISRSGITISAGRLLGLEHSAAVRFSFLLAVPTIAGAGLFSLIQGLTNPDINWSILGVVLVVSFGISFVAIQIVWRVIAKLGLLPFGVYALILGGAVLIYGLVRGF